MKKKEINPKKEKKPWPTKAAMEQVYALKLWGDNGTNFYSGEGSHHATIVRPYLEAVTSFLTSFEKPLIVCDLGCGDFNIGKELVQFTQKYIAVDIVPELVKRNKTTFTADNLVFQCLDIAVDDLPVGDCALVRQVLQHLSNTEIKSIVRKLAHFKYVILTEHLPKGDFIPNEDIISGQGIRLKKQSGVDLLTSPFHMKITAVTEIAKVTLPDEKGEIVTTLFTVF